MIKSTLWVAVLFGFSIACLAAFQQFKFPPLLPEMIALFGYSKTMAGSYMSIYALIGLIFSPILGRVLDRYGAPRALVAAAGLLMAGNFLCLFFAENAWVFLIGRGFEGMGFAVFAIAGPVIANRNASTHHLPIAIALTAIWIPVGQILAIGLVPVSGSGFGWQISWIVALVLTAGAAGWAYHLSETSPASLNMTNNMQATSAPPTKVEMRALVLGAGLFTLWSTQYFAYMTWLPHFLIEGMGLDRTSANLAYAVPVVMLIIVGMAISFVIRGGAPIGPLLAGSLVIQALVWATMDLIEGPVLGLLSLVAYGIGIGITPVCLFGIPSTVLGASRAGAKAFATIMTGRNLGVLIGPILLPQLLLLFVGSWSKASAVFAAITALAAAGAVLLTLWLLRMGRSRPS